MAALTERADSPQRACLQNARRHICFFQNKKAKSETLEEFAAGDILRSSSPIRKNFSYLALLRNVQQDALHSRRQSNCSNPLFEVARAGWTNERPFNGHNFHRMPASSSSKLDQQLPTAFSHRHDLCYSPFHLCTRMIGLFPQRGLDLF